MDNLYYQAPENRIFNEVKAAALEIWGSYDDTYGYATEKKDRIKDLTNTGDNVMYIVAMFDIVNQVKLAQAISPDARAAIRDRLKAGGMSDSFIVF